MSESRLAGSSSGSLIEGPRFGSRDSSKENSTKADKKCFLDELLVVVVVVGAGRVVAAVVMIDEHGSWASGYRFVAKGTHPLTWNYPFRVMGTRPCSPACTQLEDFEFQLEVYSHQEEFYCWIHSGYQDHPYESNPRKKAMLDKTNSVVPTTDQIFKPNPLCPIDWYMRFVLIVKVGPQVNHNSLSIKISVWGSKSNQPSPKKSKTNKLGLYTDLGFCPQPRNSPCEPKMRNIVDSKLQVAQDGRS
ncbi:uncharacterized protein G2W53_025650 [Senna tora]|uniref:Uncharacterized protein n=1 Tax=Senna tora TaxID=362788 RepID=A0A834TG60_9FABA|nr:uncharacterized protein G2W53_025650 [Senna tora]